jgi:membrane-bound ClpP family serine protease
MRSQSPEHARRRDALHTYLVASLPTWLTATAVCCLLYTRGDLPLWGAGAIVGVIIGTDVALFPRRRRYYTSEPTDTRMIDEQGVAASDLAPRGFVCVHGELWRAEAISHQTIREGDTLRVRGMNGLELLVERHDPPSPPPPR